MVQPTVIRTGTLSLDYPTGALHDRHHQDTKVSMDHGVLEFDLSQ